MHVATVVVAVGLLQLSAASLSLYPALFLILPEPKSLPKTTAPFTSVLPPPLSPAWPYSISSSALSLNGGCRGPERWAGHNQPLQGHVRETGALNQEGVFVWTRPHQSVLWRCLGCVDVRIGDSSFLFS